MSDTTPTDADSAQADHADALWRLWQKGQRPDLHAFISARLPLSSDQLGSILRVDQRERWRSGEQVRVETYLKRYPTVAEQAEAALDLIFNEFLLAEKQGARPSEASFLARFPAFADALRCQFDLHRALAGLSTPGPGVGQSARHHGG